MPILIENIITAGSSFVVESDENNVVAITHAMTRFVARLKQERGQYNLYFERYGLDGEKKISSERLYSSNYPIKHIKIHQDASSYDDGLFVAYAVEKGENNYDIIGNSIDIVFDPSEVGMVKFQAKPPLTIFESQTSYKCTHALSDDVVVIGFVRDNILTFKSIEITWNPFSLPPQDVLSDEVRVDVSSSNLQITVRPHWTEGQEYPDGHLIKLYELKSDGIYSRDFHLTSEGGISALGEPILHINKPNIKQFKVITDSGVDSVALVQEVENKQKLLIANPELYSSLDSKDLLIAETDDKDPLKIDFVSDYFAKRLPSFKERRFVGYSIGDKQYVQTFSEKFVYTDLELVGSPLETEARIENIIHVQNTTIAAGRNVVLDDEQTFTENYSNVNVTYSFSQNPNPHHSSEIFTVGNDPYTVTITDQPNVIFKYEDQFLVGHVNFKLIPGQTHSATTSPTQTPTSTHSSSTTRTASTTPIATRTPSKTPIASPSRSSSIFVPSRTPTATPSALASQISPTGESNSYDKELGVAAVAVAAIFFLALCHMARKMGFFNNRVFAKLQEETTSASKAKTSSGESKRQDETDVELSSGKASLRQNVDTHTTGHTRSDEPDTIVAKPKTSRTGCVIS